MSSHRIEVECCSCHRRQLRWSHDHPRGLRLDALYAIGWTWDGSTWQCPFCSRAGASVPGAKPELGESTVRYFYDCEFYEDGTTIDLISIAFVCSDGREFYACSTEARLDRVSDWVRANVLPRLPGYDSHVWMKRRAIADALRAFVRPAPGEERAELWSYYADYDHVCLCQLFGTMVQLPKHFPMFTRDLKQLSVDVGSPTHPPEPEDEHNALSDARWNADLYALLMAHKGRAAAEDRFAQVARASQVPQ